MALSLEIIFCRFSLNKKFDFISIYQLSNYPLLPSFVLVHCVFEKLPLSDKLSHLIGIKLFLISSSLIRNTNSKTMM